MLTGAGIGGEYAAVNSAIQELIPARLRGRIDLGGERQLLAGRRASARSAHWSLLDPAVLPAESAGARLHHRRRARARLLLVRRFLPESPRWLMTHGYAGGGRTHGGGDRGARGAAEPGRACRR